MSSAYRCFGRVLIVMAILFGSPALMAAEPTQVVCFTSNEPVGFKDPGAIGSLLLRELTRQALLIAARDELGAATRDQTLCEQFPDGAIVIDIVTAAHTRPPATLTVKLQTGNPPRSIGEVSVQLRRVPGRSFDCLQIIEQAEAWSRNEFVAALKQAGVKDQRPKPAPDEVKGLAQVETLLATTSDLLAMVNATRLSHGAAALDPANTRPLSALIRAYALLGVESEFLWYAADRVFHARALLYAERWVKRDPKSLDALQHRAFAKALAGLHTDALTDLTAATVMEAQLPAQPESKGGKLKPSWVAMMEPLCKYQTGKLVAAMKAAGANDPLPSLLCFRSVRYTDSQAAVIEYGRVALNVNPGAMSIVDRLTQLAGVSTGHGLTEGAPLMMAGLTHDRLLGAKDLPAKVRGLFGQTPDRLLDAANVARVMDALTEAAGTDRSEPSWSAVARLMEEVHFVQTYRRTYFLSQSLAVDARPYVMSRKAASGKHPYWNFIISQADNARSAELLKGMVVVDVDAIHTPLRSKLLRLSGGKDKDTWQRGDFHLDPAANSLEIRLYDYRASTTNDAYVNTLCRLASYVSPDMPGALAAAIRLTPDKVPGGLETVEKNHGHHPTVGAALIRYYLARRDDDAIINAINRYVEIAPDFWAFQELANIYERRGDEAKWLETHKRTLQSPDYGLSHARVNMQIATRYMDKGDYATAESYADDAGRSFSEWGLTCQVRCKEGLGKFDEAEKLLVARARRYGGIGAWLVWCTRTGKGDVISARKAMEAYDAELATKTDRESISSRLSYRWIIGKRLEGAKIVKDHVVETGDSYCGLLSAIAFSEAGDNASRDLMLNAVTNRGHLLKFNDRVRQELIELSREWQTAIAKPEAPLTFDKLLEIAKFAPIADRQNAYYFGSAILKLQGKTMEANRMLALCVIEPRSYKGTPTAVSHAAAELREAGFDISDTRKLKELAEAKTGK